MYKVFIDNKPINFQFNSQLDEAPDIEKIWSGIRDFLDSKEDELYIQIRNDDDFGHVFQEYLFLEAAGGLVKKNGEYLFIKRNGLWDIPKGKLEKGESPEEAAVREVEEECGIPVPVIEKHLMDTWHTFKKKGQKILKKTYWYLMKEGETIDDFHPQQEEGVSDVRFFAPGEFQIIRSNTFQSIIEVMGMVE